MNLRALAKIELGIVLGNLLFVGTVLWPIYHSYGSRDPRAEVMQNLNELRRGIERQFHQVRTKCNPPRWDGPLPFGFVTALLHNDVTRYAKSRDLRVCTAAELKSEGDKRFWDSTQKNVAQSFVVNNQLGTLGYELPENPFATFQSATTNIHVYGEATQSQIDFYGGRCAYVEAMSATRNLAYHWIFVLDSRDIFAGTRTDGMNECEW